MERSSETVPVKLSPKVYDKIEAAVVDLYMELDLTRIPINPFEIAERLGFIVHKYADLPLNVQNELRGQENEGVSLFDPTQNRFIIFYDDLLSRTRVRFTIMHEIGHIRLEHCNEGTLAKKMADYFAAYALVPSPLIRHFGCKESIDVSNRFDVSKECADICFQRYNNWLQYGGVDYKPYEIRLLNLFYDSPF